MSKWIKFDEIPNPTGKTKRWAIRTLDGETIGAVYWHSPWRKYIFQPLPGTIWEQDCLRNVSQFIENQTFLHKERRKRIKRLETEGLYRKLQD